MKKINKILVSSFVMVALFLQGNLTYAIAKEENLGEVQENKSFVVCIDPGHQKKGNSKGEPMGPSSPNMKAKVTQGTEGNFTKKPEHEVNLEAALILKKKLQDKGYEVIMTRETENIDISNIERAEIANKAKAQMTIRLHCDSINNSSKSGTVILVPAKGGKDTKNIYEDSNRYAELLKESLQKKNIRVNGIFEREDITGFNWSRVPVIIFEMGFMSNYNDDMLLSSKEHQEKLMEAVVEALDKYR